MGTVECLFNFAWQYNGPLLDKAFDNIETTESPSIARNQFLKVVTSRSERGGGGYSREVDNVNGACC